MRQPICDVLSYKWIQMRLLAHKLKPLITSVESNSILYLIYKRAWFWFFPISVPIYYSTLESLGINGYKNHVCLKVKHNLDML